MEKFQSALTVLKFDEGLFCHTMGIEDEGSRYYNNTSLIGNENIFSTKRFKQVFPQGKQFDEAHKRVTIGFYAYGRLLHHMLTYTVVPSKRHSKHQSLFYMHMVLMQAIRDVSENDFQTHFLEAHVKCYQEIWK